MAAKVSTDKKGFSRRKFFQRGAIVLGGLVVSSYLGRGRIRRFLAETIEAYDVPSVISTYDPHFWFEILADNSILLRSPKVEMGQGIFTGMAMLAAEELEVPLKKIKVEHAKTKNGPVDNLNTGGSNTTSSLFIAIREVAATLREMLKAAAAQRWNVESTVVEAKDGFLIAGTQKVSYAEIAQMTKDWKVPKTPPLKPVSSFKYVGQSVKRIDLEPKVLAQVKYGIDHSLPDQLFALTLQSPYLEAKLESVDTKAAKTVPGVVRIIEEKDLVAVVATNRYAAEQGLQKLEAKWQVSHKWQQAELEKIVTVGNGSEVQVQWEGQPDQILKEKADKVFRREYRTPLAAHAHMEPNGALAKVTEQEATIIMGTQAPNMIRQQVGKALRRKASKINIETTYSGGAFGRRVHINNAAQAARIAEIMGKPVSVFNTREQEFRNAHYRPNTHHVLQAVIGADGQIEAITHDQATSDMILRPLAGDVVINIAGADFISAGHAAGLIYNIKNRAAAVWHTQVPLQTGIWRSVGLFANTFAIESFINELAHKIGKDPLALRLELMQGSDKTSQRYQNVLKALQEKSNWKTPKAAGVGRGMALAYDRKTITAAAVEVSIDDDGIHVQKVTNVIDAGFAVNPEGIRMQVEGCVMMGIGATLYEELTIKDGQIEATNFHQYILPTLKDTPEIEVVILEGAEVPYGVGEPPLGPIAPAITAAILDLTGKAVRRLPIKLPLG